MYKFFQFYMKNNEYVALITEVDDEDPIKAFNLKVTDDSVFVTTDPYGTTHVINLEEVNHMQISIHEPTPEID